MYTLLQLSKEKAEVSSSGSHTGPGSLLPQGLAGAAAALPQTKGLVQ